MLLYSRKTNQSHPWQVLANLGVTQNTGPHPTNSSTLTCYISLNTISMQTKERKHYDCCFLTEILKNKESCSLIEQEHILAYSLKLCIKLTEGFILRTHGHTDKHEFTGPPILGIQKKSSSKDFKEAIIFPGNKIKARKDKLNKIYLDKIFCHNNSDIMIGLFGNLPLQIRHAKTKS